MEFARKGKLKKNGKFWQSVELARNGKLQGKTKLKLQGKEITRNRNCKEMKFAKNGICKEIVSQVTVIFLRAKAATAFSAS